MSVLFFTCDTREPYSYFLSRVMQGSHIHFCITCDARIIHAKFGYEFQFDLSLKSNKMYYFRPKVQIRHHIKNDIYYEIITNNERHFDINIFINSCQKRTYYTYYTYIWIIVLFLIIFRDIRYASKVYWSMYHNRAGSSYSTYYSSIETYLFHQLFV